MAKNSRDTRARAHAMLTSLRKIIAPMSSPIPEKYVHKFHTALDKLESISIDVSEFRVPDSELKHRDTVAPMYVGGERITPYKPSEEKYVDKPFILTQLDAILGYLDSLTSDKPEKPRTIGYHTSDNQ